MTKRASGKRADKVVPWNSKSQYPQYHFICSGSSYSKSFSTSCPLKTEKLKKQRCDQVKSKVGMVVEEIVNKSRMMGEKQVRPEKNALFPAHQATKINILRATAK